MSPRLLLLAAFFLLSFDLGYGEETSITSRYSLREEVTQLQLPFKQDVALGALPFDKPYSALTQRQQESVKAQYVQLSEGDEPPFPEQGLKAIYVPIARAQGTLNIEGDVSMEVEVSATGAATEVRVLRSPSTEATDLISGIALLTKYKPAVCSGSPCAMSFPIRMYLADSPWAVDQHQTCMSSASALDDRIGACTDAIRSGRLSAHSLVRTLASRGQAWRAKGDSDRAIADLDASIKLDSQNWFGFINRGMAWQDKGDDDKAILDFNEAIQLRPKDPIAFIERGNAWRRKGVSDKALADFDEAILFDPHASGVFVSRGLVLGAKGDLDSAMADFSEAIRLSPTYSVAFLDRGNAWWRKGASERAISDYDEAIRLNPKYQKAFFVRGIAKYYLGRFDAAASDFKEGIRLDPKYAYSPIWYSLALRRAGQAGLAHSQLLQATQSFEKGRWPEPVMELLSEQMDPTALLNSAESPDTKKRANQLCEAHFYLGEYYLVNGRDSEARAPLENAEKECPQNFVEYFGAVTELKHF